MAVAYTDVLGAKERILATQDAISKLRKLVEHELKTQSISHFSYSVGIATRRLLKLLNSEVHVISAGNIRKLARFFDVTPMDFAVSLGLHIAAPTSISNTAVAAVSSSNVGTGMLSAELNESFAPPMIFTLGVFRVIIEQLGYTPTPVVVEQAGWRVTATPLVTEPLAAQEPGAVPEPFNSYSTSQSVRAASDVEQEEDIDVEQPEDHGIEQLELSA